MKGTATKEKSIFVSVPKGLDVTTLTEKDLAALYTAGLEKKKAQKSNPLKKKENPTIE
jgi:hypothetical protein